MGPGMLLSAPDIMAGVLDKAKAAVEKVRKKNLGAWTAGYARWLAASSLPRARAAARRNGPRHLLFALCDHYEPLWHTSDRKLGAERVRLWVERYPALAERFRDADGHPPRHSFFFPGEEYETGYLDGLATLAARGFGEVELHLHHDRDTAPALREKIAEYLRLYATHGHLSRDPGGRLRYAFIHGNWCLANARADGRWCGVDGELPLLHETGCYADFTFPAAPDESQPAIVNRIYWPEGDLARRRAYEQGTAARVGARRDDRLLMIEGPLAFSLRPGRLLSPRIENAAVTGEDPATPARVRTWVRQGIGVAGRPEWVFVKAHTHGTQERASASLLGAGGEALHTELTTRYNDGRRWVLHYLTAREMYNVAMAAMDGRDGDPGAYRDYLLPPPPVAGRSAASGQAAAQGT
jgi:hypothetical protein